MGETCITNYKDLQRIMIGTLHTYIYISIALVVMIDCFALRVVWGSLEAIHNEQHNRLELLVQLEGLALWNLDPDLYIPCLGPHPEVRAILQHRASRRGYWAQEGWNLLRWGDLESVSEGGPPCLVARIPGSCFQPAPRDDCHQGSHGWTEHILLLHRVRFSWIISGN